LPTDDVKKYGKPPHKMAVIQTRTRKHESSAPYGFEKILNTVR
jgi:hypothetical protein